MLVHKIDRAGVTLHATEQGAGRDVVLVHALGLDHHVWDEMIAHMPNNIRIICADMRGHGQSDVPDGPYSMGALIADLEAICVALNVKDAIVVGLSIGGMIAQGLAVKRLDLVRGLVLSNTAAKIAQPSVWRKRIEAIQVNGLGDISDDTIQRWFSKDFLRDGDVAHWRNQILQTNVTGYAACCAAIAGTDFFTPTSSLRLPTLGIAGSEDGSTPPDLVRETINLIPGSRFELMRRVGHLPCVEKPAEVAALLTEFLTDTGHI